MLAEILVLTVLLELLTCLGRFGFKMRARDWKWPVRIHHGYVGILLILVFAFVRNDWLLIIGSALLFSDALHHFVVLRTTVGSSEFP